MLTLFLSCCQFIDFRCVFFGVNEIKLKVHSCKFHNKKHIALTQMINTEMFAFRAVLAFKLLSQKVFFINKTIETVK